MRPVIRGNCPQNRQGEEIRFSDHTKARSELIKRMGEYCSYCEMHLDSSLAVEHVQPKKPPGASLVDQTRTLDWNNFLLACTNCNSTKGNKDVDLDDCLWPDRDNTFRALTYSEGGLVSANMNIQKKRALKLIKLVGLDKAPNTSTASDRRWLNRREAWEMASRAKERLNRCNSEDMKEQILDTVQAKGYWSIWMTVFKDDSDMLRRFIEAFSGTDRSCFDVANGYVSKSRVGGQC